MKIIGRTVAAMTNTMRSIDMIAASRARRSRLCLSEEISFAIGIVSLVVTTVSNVVLSTDDVTVDEAIFLFRLY